MFRGKKDKDKGKHDKDKHDKDKHDKDDKKISPESTPTIKGGTDTKKGEISPRKKEEISPRLDSPGRKEKEKKGLFGLFSGPSKHAPPVTASKGDSDTQGDTHSAIHGDDKGGHTVVEEKPNANNNAHISTPAEEVSKGGDQKADAPVAPPTTDDSTTNTTAENGDVSKRVVKGVSIDRREELRKRNTVGRNKSNLTVVSRRTMKFVEQAEVINGEEKESDDIEGIFLDFERKNFVCTGS